MVSGGFREWGDREHVVAVPTDSMWLVYHRVLVGIEWHEFTKCFGTECWVLIMAMNGLPYASRI